MAACLILKFLPTRNLCNASTRWAKMKRNLTRHGKVQTMNILALLSQAFQLKIVHDKAKMQLTMGVCFPFQMICNMANIHRRKVVCQHAARFAYWSFGIRKFTSFYFFMGSLCLRARRDRFRLSFFKIFRTHPKVLRWYYFIPLLRIQPKRGRSYPGSRIESNILLHSLEYSMA